MLIFEDKVKNNVSEFTQKVIAIASRLNTNPNFLMAVMNAESGINPAKQNLKYPLHNGSATGLIQFTPDTAASLGTSIDDLKNMDNVSQLNYVESYFKPYANRLNSYFDVYIAVFFPAAIGKPDDWIFETSNIKSSSVARQNPSIDQNKDGKITVAEFKQYLTGTIPAQLRNLIFNIEQALKENGTAIVALVAIAAVYFLLIKK